jgi:hypothetical protein
MTSRLALSAATAPPRLAVLFKSSTSERKREASPERKTPPPVMPLFHLIRLWKRRNENACERKDVVE